MTLLPAERAHISGEVSPLLRLRGITTLPPAQRTIANYVHENPATAATATIEELASRCGVSTASLTRFCRRLGYTGYPDFQRALTVHLARSPAGARDIHEDVAQDDRLPIVAQKVFNTASQTMSDTIHVVDPDALQNAVDTIGAARQIALFGAGGSGIVALDTYHKFLTIGIPVTAPSDSHMQAMVASLLNRGDVGIGISHTGATSETLRALAQAKSRGATTIAITNYRNSPIARIADICLFTASRETTERGFRIASRLAQLLLLDIVFVGVAVKRFEESLESIYRTGEATRSYPAGRSDRKRRGYV